MSEPSTKRRKISNARSEASDGLRSTPRRASFMSPTKASLARFNPNLLSQKAPTSPSRSRPASRNGDVGKGQGPRDYVLGVRPDEDEESPVKQASERKRTASAREPAVPLELERHSERNFESQETTSSPSKLQPLAQSTRNNIKPPPEPLEDEADLPATPQGLENIEYDPPPRGILFSSPSKRGRRAKSLAHKVQSSPLKPVNQQLPAPQIRDSQLSSPTRRSVPDSQNVDVVQPPEPIIQDTELREKADEMRGELQQKIRKRNEMKSEIKDLIKDVNGLEATITALDSGNANSANQDVDLENLIDLIIGTDEVSGSDLVHERIPISQALLSFGPFSNFLKTAQPPSPDEEEDIPSHQPIKEDDPLPYLRAFTPFAFSSQISTPTSDPENTLQTHRIQVCGPKKLFRANVEMTVDTQHERISRLSINSLPAWTEAELGTWIRLPAKQGGPTENDISSICWAMGSYWDLAVKRARCWARCQKAFAHLLPDLPERIDEDSEEAEAVGSDEEDGTGEGRNSKFQLQSMSLVPYLGRRGLVLRRNGVLLEIRWMIGFDWTGEAESEVSVDYECPKIWHKMDDRKSLMRIPETFQSLVKSRGIFDAVRVMAVLMFPES